MIFRRPFRDVVRRQLALFHDDQHELVTRARRKLRDYHAERDPELAQEHYADHDLLADAVEDGLYDMCVRYASTLEQPARSRYVREFDHQARRSYRDVIPQLDIYGRSGWE